MSVRVASRKGYYVELNRWKQQCKTLSKVNPREKVWRAGWDQLGWKLLYHGKQR